MELTEKNSSSWKRWHCSLQGIPEAQPEQLRRWTYQHKLGKRLWRKWWRFPRGSSLTKDLTLKEFSEIFHNFECVKDKMLEADPNLERGMTVHPGTAKPLPPCLVMWREGNRCSNYWDKWFGFFVLFLQGDKTLQFSMNEKLLLLFLCFPTFVTESKRVFNVWTKFLKSQK